MQPNNLVHFPPAQKLGRYEIVSVVAQGAMGTVYKAIDPLIERTVAIKTINIDLSQEELAGFEERFYREAKSAGRLNHPNIITIYDVGKTDHIAYIAMEFLEGQSLRELLDSGVVLTTDRIVKIIGQIAKGLAYAEKYNIVHRDIKPANIFITRNGLVKITDFGIAYTPSTSRTVAGMVFGSPKYMSPEQVEGKPVDGRSDIFSLGVLLYEMLTGKPPFEGDNISTVMYRIVNEMPNSPSKINARIPIGFDYIISKALAKVAEERYQSAKEFANDLANYKTLTEPRSKEVVRPKTAFLDTVEKRETGSGTVPNAKKKINSPKGSEQATSSKKFIYYGLGILVIAFAITLILFKDRFTPSTLPTPPIAKPDTIPPSIEPPAIIPPQVTITLPNNTPTNSVQPNVEVKNTDVPANIAAAGPIDIDPEIEKPLPVSKPSKPKKVIAIESKVIKHDELRTQPKLIEETKAHNEEIKSQGEITDNNAAVLDFAIAPWGEVYIDGKKVGISPPLKTFKVSAGKHLIEIKNTDLPTYSTTLDVEAQATKKIKHRFIILNDK